MTGEKFVTESQLSAAVAGLVTQSQLRTELDALRGELIAKLASKDDLRELEARLEAKLDAKFDGKIDGLRTEMRLLHESTRDSIQMLAGHVATLASSVSELRRR